MGVVLVQLGDLHATSTSTLAPARWTALCRAVEADVSDPDVSACVVVFCGDAAHGGQPSEFEAAAARLGELQSCLAAARPGIPVYILTVPGNHDSDFATGDQEARLSLRGTLEAQLPADSTANVLLQPQRHYFDFAAAVGEHGSALSLESPYYKCFHIRADGHMVRFHLLNSAWTSIIRETDDLRFPLEAFSPPTEPDAEIAVAVLHHPVHWFLMGSVRRELRNRIEAHSDVILTAHEHENEKSRRVVQGGGEIDYIEGGVLCSVEHPDECKFNVITLNIHDRLQSIRRYSWSSDHFEPQGGADPTPLLPNSARVDRLYRLRQAFEQGLDELDDPVIHPREPNLRLSQLFMYPDLHKVLETSRGSKGESSRRQDERVRSEVVFMELCGQCGVLITGGDRSGKTSLAKRLFADFRRAGRVPLMLRGTDLAGSGSVIGLRNTCDATVTRQYQSLTPAGFEQLAKEDRVLIVDDFQDGPTAPQARRKVIDHALNRFGTVVFIAADDFNVELFGQRGEDIAALLACQRYVICDFGHLRFEDLATRWMSLGQKGADPAQIKAKSLELCERVQSVLGVAGLPHTPWLLTVMLEQADTPDAPILGARNGDYGHLYHAVITIALNHSRLRSFDLSGKFTYLGELAFRLYRDNKAIHTDQEAREFHREHCRRYDLPFEFDQVTEDLVQIRMLRRDGDQFAFRHKWVYCFFVAWWLSRNLHKDEASRTVDNLVLRLHHEISANVLLFLAHLTENTIVIRKMCAAAGALFAGAPAASIDDDVHRLNELEGVEGRFILPRSSPDINRRLLLEAEDDHLARSGSAEHDGRSVRPVPDGEEVKREELHRQMDEVRGALKTIRILGQVLRNGASSIEGEEKQAIMRELLGVGRRLLGRMFECQRDLDAVVRFVRSRVFRMLIQDKAPQKGGIDGAAGDVDSVGERCGLTKAERREFRKAASTLASRFWFDLIWLATFSMLKRLSFAIGMPLLDTTFTKIRTAEDNLVFKLVRLMIRLNRRQRTVPADEIVELHKSLGKSGNKLARILLEAMSWERLLLFETSYDQTQQICEQMGIKVPTAALDSSRRSFCRCRDPVEWGTATSTVPSDTSRQLSGGRTARCRSGLRWGAHALAGGVRTVGPHAAIRFANSELRTQNSQFPSAPNA